MTRETNSRMKISHHFTGGIFAYTDLTFARLAVSVGSLVWAFILLLLGHQFDRPVYVHMAALAPQWVWGLLFACCGMLQMVRLFLDVPLTAGRYACVVSGLTAWLWCFVTVELWMALTPPTAVVAGNASIAFLSGVIFIRTVAKRE